MPSWFKNLAPDTDGPGMSETIVNETPGIDETPAASETSTSFLLDGDAPRLGSPRPMQPSLVPTPAFVDLDGGPTLPVVSPVLSDGAPTLPSLPALPGAAAISGAGLPTLPSLPALPGVPAPAGTAPSAGPGEEPTPERRHPMAHLMPEKIKPSEASLRAAEARAVKKAKAKKIKLAVAAGLLVLAVVVGPPLGRWLVDAINEAGSTKSEQPAG